MSEGPNGIDGCWAILELMGHRRLAGYLSQTMVGPAVFIRIDVPTGCEGATIDVVECTEHGWCRCKRTAEGSLVDAFDPLCTLHGPGSRHGEKYSFTQFYAPASVYCITPTTEANARAVAEDARPIARRPFVQSLPLAAGQPDDDEDEDLEDEDLPDLPDGVVGGEGGA